MERNTIAIRRASFLALMFLTAAVLLSGCVPHHHNGPSGPSGGPGYTNSRQYNNPPAHRPAPARNMPGPGFSGGPGGRR